jgi:predicted dehydrogenase
MYHRFSTKEVLRKNHMVKPLKTAVIGCGNISDIYFQNFSKWDVLDVVACSSLNMESAEKQAAKYHLRALTVKGIIADTSIALIVNLTPPDAHGKIGLAAVRAGKNIYNEKPLAIKPEDAALMLRAARLQGLRVGCAPDTFLGGGLQTCRQLVDEGALGQPIVAHAHFLAWGPEHKHPDPEFFYKAGAGPLFDMGPYYLTALVSLFGPVRKVTGITRITSAERTISSEPRRGEKIEVETPTSIAAVLEFESGLLATLAVSFDVGEPKAPFLEIHGTKGILRAPDPNTFGGPVWFRQSGAEEWGNIPLAFGYTENSRGIGAADMVYAIRGNKPHRASGEMAYHVLEVMHSVLESSATGRHVTLESTCERPAPFIDGLG